MNERHEKWMSEWRFLLAKIGGINVDDLGEADVDRFRTNLAKDISCPKSDIKLKDVLYLFRREADPREQTKIRNLEEIWINKGVSLIDGGHSSFRKINT